MSSFLDLDRNENPFLLSLTQMSVIFIVPFYARPQVESCNLQLLGVDNLSFKV